MNQFKTDKPAFSDWMRSITIGLYIVLVTVIVLHTIVELYNVKSKENSQTEQSDSKDIEKGNGKTSASNEKEMVNKQEKSTGEKKKESKITVTELVVKPIVQNKVVQILLSNLFYLLVVVLMFLVIPAGLYRLRRFKIFNLEFEVNDKDEAIIETFELTASKTKFLAEMTRTVEKEYYMEQKHTGEINQFLFEFLQEMRDFYKAELGTPFSFELITKEEMMFDPYIFSSRVMDSLGYIDEEMEPVIINKFNRDNIHEKSYLIYKGVFEEKETFIVLSRHRSEFDQYDRSVLLGIVELAKQYEDDYLSLEILDKVQV
ncbi:hypothetical protein [Peribacillus glennii]|uniref:Uncharacterized protein n=1 Tax=Peribacillus glennii TaxID=2303991 RepID=A0A372L7Y0_9BACI|nr:hypothetical protein [Peribacillus glennii]RFU61102.1 hypothetical protein D0466_19145 [Peribacillus glennii]